MDAPADTTQARSLSRETGATMVESSGRAL